MFTGIIESKGKVIQVTKENTNLHLTIESPLTPELKIDQSLAHNGVCLTVVELNLDQNTYVVTAIEETLNLSNIGSLKPLDYVNLERCLTASHRIDGHFVQGHVDTTATLESLEDLNGSWRFTFIVKNCNENLMVHKGSITINGVSLTLTEVAHSKFSVCIIPYTFEETNFGSLKVGDIVNIEYDIMGKYIEKMMKTKD